MGFPVFSKSRARELEEHGTGVLGEKVSLAKRKGESSSSGEW